MTKPSATYAVQVMPNYSIADALRFDVDVQLDSFMIQNGALDSKNRQDGKILIVSSIGQDFTSKDINRVKIARLTKQMNMMNIYPR